MRVQNRATNAGAYRYIYIDTYIGRRRRAHRGKFSCIGIYEWAGKRERKICACEMGRLTQEAVYINKYMSHTGGKEWEFFGEGVYWWAGKHERKNNKIFLEKLTKGEYFVSIYRGHR